MTSNDNRIRIYLDTNVFSRPFDEQSYARIRDEAQAFVQIISEINANRILLICSDILDFEVSKIFHPEKRMRIKTYLELCTDHVENTADSLQLGTQIQMRCQLRARDALHVASAMLASARYFLSCDKQLVSIKRNLCFGRVAKSLQMEDFAAMNPKQFVDQQLKLEH